MLPSSAEKLSEKAVNFTQINQFANYIFYVYRPNRPAPDVNLMMNQFLKK